MEQRISSYFIGLSFLLLFVFCSADSIQAQSKENQKIVVDTTAKVPGMGNHVG